MIRPRWSKILSDLWSNKVRSLLVISSIGIGLFAVGLIASGYFILSNDMGASYASVNPANIRIIAELFDDNFIETVRRMPEIAEAEGRYTLIVRLKTGEDEWISLNLTAIPDLADAQIDQLELLQGTLPTKEGELALDINKLDDTKAALGDTVILQLPSGIIREMPVVGIVRSQTIGSSGGTFFTEPPQGYITFTSLPRLGLPEKYNQLAATVKENPLDQVHIEHVTRLVKDQFTNSNLLVYQAFSRRSDAHPNLTYMDAMAGVLFLLGLLVVFLSGFLITNTLAALFSQQIQQIGIMKSTGARWQQIVGMYLVFILVFGILAFLLAVPLSFWVSYALAEMLAGTLNFNLMGFRITPLVVYLEIAIAILVPVAAGLAPVWNGSRISVQKAIYGAGLEGARIRRGPIDRLIASIHGVSRPLLISLRNTFRQKVRLGLTLFTLTLGGAVFIATFNVRVSLEDYVDRISRYFLADINLNFDQYYRMEKVKRIAQLTPGVAQIEGWAGARCELILEDGTAGDSVLLIAPPASSPLVEPILLKGRWLKPGDSNAIALNESFLNRYPHLQPGDSIRLRVNGKEVDWVVVGFFQFVGNGQFLAYTNYDYLAKITGQLNQSSTYRIVVEEGYKSRQVLDELSRKLDADFRAQGFKVSEVKPGLSLLDSVTEGLDILTAFLLIMAMLTALVGSVGLMGTMSMNVLERTREIGVMRAIGATDRIITRLVIAEGVFIGMISWVLGVGLAFPISRMMSDIVSLALFNTPANFSFTITGFLVWLGAVLVLSTLASVLPARSAASLTIREVLAYE